MCNTKRNITHSSQFCPPRKAHAEPSLGPRGVHQRNHRILPISSLRVGREQHVPDSSNHVFFLKMKATSEGTSYQMVRLVFRHLRRKRTICPSASPLAFARVSPDFAFFRHFLKLFPRVTLTHTTLKITVSGRCACACGCVLCVSVCVCMWKKDRKTEKPREIRVVWCSQRDLNNVRPWRAIR